MACQTSGPPAPDARPARLPVGPAGCVRFLVLGAARTGSSLVVQALTSSPAIRCFGELFNPNLDFVPYGVDGYDSFDRRDRRLRDRDPIAFLQRRIFCEHPAHVRAVGFKLLYAQDLHWPGLIEAVTDERDLRVIHLKRRNMLRTLTSLKIAQATGRWRDNRRGLAVRRRVATAARHPWRTVRVLQGLLGRRATGRAPIRISPEELRRFCQEQDQRAGRYEHLFAGHETLPLFYEDILQDHDAALEAAQSFLGVEPRPLSVTLRRQNPEPLRELIANYDELHQALAGTPAAEYFADSGSTRSRER